MFSRVYFFFLEKKGKKDISDKVVVVEEEKWKNAEDKDLLNNAMPRNFERVKRNEFREELAVPAKIILLFKNKKGSVPVKISDVR